MVFHWSLSDNKSPRVPRTFLSILTDLKNLTVWMFLVRRLISNSIILLSQPLGTVPSAPITTGITFTIMFHSFLSSQVRSKYLFLFVLFDYYIVVRRDGKVNYTTGSLFLFIITSSSRLPEIGWSVCILQRILFIPFSSTDSDLCLYHFFVWSNFIFLHNSQ